MGLPDDKASNRQRKLKQSHELKYTQQQIYTYVACKSKPFSKNNG